MAELNIKTSLSNQGYAIYKSKITSTELETIKTDMTIKPFTCPGYGNEDGVEPYKLFKENSEKIYVPYYYGINKFGKPEKTKIKEPEPIDITWSPSRPMRPYQQEIIKTYMDKAREIGGGIISVGCGRGKTVMALKIAEELKVKTLILVHKEFLMNQWIERIKEYIPEAKIGYIQGKTLDIARKDIVLAMIQSLSDPRKDGDYPANLFEPFGLIIADECHHLAAKQFCRSLAKYPIKYTLGLSATPDRADGLTRVFKHYLGDIVYQDSEIQKSAEDIALDHIPNSTVEIYVYRNSNPKYSKEELNFKQKPNIVTMKSNIANCRERTEYLLSFLPRLIGEGRTILLLSCRRAHIDQMEKMINEMNIPECSVGQYVGGMKQEDLDVSATKRVIIATYDMAEEAFDCKTLNTLIYATPHKNIKQAVGRILREEKKKRKMIPLIIDLFDVFSTFNGWNRKREKYYKEEGYPMKIFEAVVQDSNDKGKDNKKNNLPVVSFVKEVGVAKVKTCNTKKNKIVKNKDIEDDENEDEEKQDNDIDEDEESSGDDEPNERYTKNLRGKKKEVIIFDF